MDNIEFKITKNTVIIALCVVIGILIAYIVLNAVSSSSQPMVVSVTNPAQTNTTTTQNQNTTVTVAPVVPDFTITPSSDSPDVNIFSATKLGITFQYLKYVYSDNENNPGIDRTQTVNPPKIDGNNISFGPTYSSYMTVYQKDPNQSLEAAVKAQFLANVPSTQCLVSRVQAGADDAFYTPTSQISFVRLNSVTPNGCSPQFNFSNPSAAFFSFADQPDKFFYVTGEADGTMPLDTPTGDPFFTTIQSLNQ